MRTTPDHAIHTRTTIAKKTSYSLVEISASKRIFVLTVKQENARFFPIFLYFIRFVRRRAD